MTRLSVNVNKIATLRNSRGGHVPSVLDAVRVCLDAGVAGITVHPRADCRHITPQDVRDIAAALEDRRPEVEFNIEGDPRPDWLDLVHAVQPDQCTLVPVAPGEITSQAGWRAGPELDRLPGVISGLKRRGIRVSAFVDAEEESVLRAAAAGADRVELYTEPFARAFEQGKAAGIQCFERYSAMSRIAHDAGLGVNAGHDLDLENLALFRHLPHLDEV